MIRPINSQFQTSEPLLLGPYIGQEIFFSAGSIQLIAGDRPACEVGTGRGSTARDGWVVASLSACPCTAGVGGPSVGAFLARRPSSGRCARVPGFPPRARGA